MDAPYPHTVLAIGSRSICVWDQELKQHNLDFCESFDAQWFLTTTASHLGDTEDITEVSQPAALAVRQTYHHALETFFGLLFAFFQAPYCLPAWLELYEYTVLRDLIVAVRSRAPILNAWGMPTPSWEDLARLTTESGWPSDEDTFRRFGLLWQRLATEYLDEQRASEYAALKHGFRARPSGGGIRIGLEREYGIAPPPDEMKWIGGSSHGSSIFVASPIPAGAGRRKAVHYHLRVQNTFWLLETTILKIQLLSMSMENILAATRVHNGAAANTILFHRPQDPAAFDAPWTKSTGVTGFNMNLAGPGLGVQHIPRVQVEARMREASGFNDSSDAAEPPT